MVLQGWHVNSNHNTWFWFKGVTSAVRFHGCACIARAVLRCAAVGSGQCHTGVAMGAVCCRWAALPSAPALCSMPRGAVVYALGMQWLACAVFGPSMCEWREVDGCRATSLLHESTDGAAVKACRHSCRGSAAPLRWFHVCTCHASRCWLCPEVDGRMGGPAALQQAGM